MKFGISIRNLVVESEIEMKFGILIRNLVVESEIEMKLYQNPL